MSTTIDHRVVEMQFDNGQFEKGVSTTMSSLDKLKQSLNMTGASKGLENVSDAAKRCDMGSLGSAVEAVQVKFSAMGVMATTWLTRIANSAYNTGTRMIKALTIDPITTGFSEYETKINAIQTIMSNTASKGTTMEDVTRVIGDLNTYADKTIYNFAEMTRNIGTFTAAGVDLEDSASAIQGIANLAAASGSSSQQASTAMYQLSQALAAGQVKLMDWNSVVNAGMGGEKFQEALKATARDHGIAVDEIIKKNGSFRESLQEGWISADILNETLSKFTVEGAKEYAQSMMDSGKWTQEQADALIQEAQAMEDAATKVKTFTQLWDTLKESAQSGWSQTWEILIGDFEEAKETLTKISEVVGGVISASADARNELLQGWKDAGGRTHLVDSLFNVINALGSIIKPIKEAFRDIFPPVTVDQLLKITSGIRDLTAKLTLSETASNNLKRTFKGLFAVVDIVKQIFVGLIQMIAPLFGGLDNLGGGVLGVTAKIGDWLVALNESIKASGFFTTAVEKIHAAFEKVKTFLQPIVEGFKKFGNEVTNTATAAASNAEARLGPLATIGKVILGVFAAIGGVIKKIFPYIAAAATGIGNVIKDLMNRISSSIQDTDYDGMFDLASGGIIAAIGVFIAKFIKSGGDLLDNAGGFIDGLKGILGGVSDALGAFTESLKADVLKKIAISIGILAASLLVLSLIDSDKLYLSLTIVTTLFAELMGSMSAFTKITSGSDLKGLNKISAAMVALAAALFILAIALKIMSTMSWEEMSIGLITMVVGLSALVGAVNLLPDSKVKNAANAIRAMAVAILILAVGIKIMSTMSWEEMGIGLITMVAALYALVGAVNLLPKDTGMRAAGMIALATAMVVIGAALKIMATMSWSEVAVGLTVLAGSLAILAGAMHLMKSAIPGALAMMIVAPALLLLAGALKIMATMSWQEVAVGLVALAGSLLIIGVAMLAMTSAIPGALAMMIVAPALLLLAGALKIMGSMSLQEIGMSLLALAGVFVVLGLAGLILAPLVPSILGLSAALLMLGVGCVAIGAGVILISAGLTALSAALATSGVAITAFIASLISLIPFVIEQIGLGIIRLCEVIAGGSVAICAAAAAIIVALANALIVATPPLMKAVGVILDELIKLLIEYVPKLTDAAMKLIVGFLNGISNNIGDVISAGADLVVNFLDGLGAEIPRIIDSAFQLIVDFIEGLATAVDENSDALNDAVLHLITAIVDAIADFASNLWESGKDLLDGLWQGIKENMGALIDKVIGAIEDLWDNVLEFFGIESPSKLAAEAGMYIDQGLALGFEKYAGVVSDAAIGVGKKAMSSLQKSLSRVSDVVNSGIDAQPTIRPVLDLSEVTSGANSINSMFAGGRTLSVNPQFAGLASVAMSTRQNGDGSKEVVAAIKALRKDIANMPRNQTNINGVTYDDGSNINKAVQDIVHYARVARRS